MVPRYNEWKNFQMTEEKCLIELSIFSLHVTTSIYPVPSICSQDQISDWFASLADCLHWNERKKQKAMDDHSRSSSDDTLDSLEQKAESLSEAASSSATE